jgi:hypothetical protein
VGSYILAAIILVPTVLVAAFLAYMMDTGLWKRVAIPVAILVIGSAAAWAAFTINRSMEITTLHEVMLEGNLGVKEGDPPPRRETSFRVEHPGVEHELMFSPKGDSEDFPVKVGVKLFDPAGEVVLEDQYTFVPKEDRLHGVITLQWPGRTLTFRPEQEGDYRLWVTPRTPGIRGVHVRIADPEKTDGKRMPGY